MKSIQQKILIAGAIVILALIGTVAAEWHQLQKITQKWEIAEANVKSYSNELSSAKKGNSALQLTVDQLSYFKDSVLMELDNTRKQLNIKDKNLKALQAISSGFKKKDTIRITQVDTLFKEPTLAIDTLIGDKWYNLKLGLKYPSTIAVEPYFKSEKHIIVSTKKETINPPKKFVLFRWFQKKHTVLSVDVVEQNPYVEEETSKYVEILK